MYFVVQITSFDLMSSSTMRNLIAISKGDLSALKSLPILYGSLTLWHEFFPYASILQAVLRWALSAALERK